MRRQPSGFRELEQHGLRKLIGMQVRRFLGVPHAVDKRLWPQRPAHAQSGEAHLRKAAQQNGAGLIVQLLDGRYRFAFVAQFAIGVVFHHGHARRPRGLQQRSPRCQRQRGPGWVLKVGGDHQQPRTIAQEHALQLREIDSAGAHRNTRQLYAHSGQKVFQARIHRIFDRHHVARTQKSAGDQIERLLAAVGHDEVVARRGQTLRARVIEQITPQRFVAAGRTELEDIGEIVTRQHGLATGAEIVQREQLARWTRHRRS